MATGFVAPSIAIQPLSVLPSEVLCVQERPTGGGRDTTGPPAVCRSIGAADFVTTDVGGRGRREPSGFWILTAVALVVITGVGEKGSCTSVMVLAAGLSNDRGVNSGASGFSFDPYKQEAIRNCQRMHITMILERSLYLFLVVQGCLHLRGLIHTILGRLLCLRFILLGIHGSRSFRGVRSLRLTLVTLIIRVLFLGLDEDLGRKHQY